MSYSAKQDYMPTGRIIGVKGIAVGAAALGMSGCALTLDQKIGSFNVPIEEFDCELKPNADRLARKYDGAVPGTKPNGYIGDREANMAFQDALRAAGIKTRKDLSEMTPRQLNDIAPQLSDYIKDFLDVYRFGGCRQFGDATEAEVATPDPAPSAPAADTSDQGEGQGEE